MNTTANAAKNVLTADVEIKGSFRAGRLVIPAANHFHWPQPISVDSAEVAGELVSHLLATQTVTLTSTARFFGTLEAANLVVQEGAVILGHLLIGSPKSLLYCRDPDALQKSVACGSPRVQR